MKKAVASILMAGALICSMTAAVSADEIKIWVAENVVDFTNEEVAKFKEAYPEYAAYDVIIEPVAEDIAADRMIADVTSGADVYGFAQDQLARLVSAGALIEVAPDYQDQVLSANDIGSLRAASAGDTLYAYPLTSDNGYFLYYDKSVISDPESLEGILADCEAAGKNFYMEINSGWYQTAFFFATGSILTYATDSAGKFISCDASYASPEGLVALKEMINLKSSPVFRNGSSLGEATNVGAIVDGTWDASAAKKIFGDNYACAKLPTFEGSDGNTYQMSGFGGFKLLGEKPQEDEIKLAACDALAAFLSGEEAQLARFKAVEWGPSNINVQESAEVQADEALSALADQLSFTIPQGQYPGEYWSLATSLGDRIINGELTAAASDTELMEVLQNFEDNCRSYAQ